MNRKTNDIFWWCDSLPPSPPPLFPPAQRGAGVGRTRYSTRKHAVAVGVGVRYTASLACGDKIMECLRVSTEL